MTDQMRRAAELGEKALKKSFEKYEDYIGMNDKRDAYRHALWVGYMTLEFGKDNALAIANMREFISDAQDRTTGKKDEAGCQMDYHNNGAAAKLADNPMLKTHDDIERIMEVGVETGVLKVLNNNKKK